MSVAYLGLIVIVIFAGGSTTEEVHNGTVLVTPVQSEVGNTTGADSAKSDDDDMQTSASTNIVHWMSTLSTGKTKDSTLLSGKEIPNSPGSILGNSSSGTSAGDVAAPIGNVTANPHGQHIAEEVSDMNIDPYRNHTVPGTAVSSADDSADKTVNKDTVTVQDSHVVVNNKTHEEGASVDPPTHGSDENTEKKAQERTASEHVLKPADASVKASPGSVEILDARQQSDTESVKLAVGSGATEVAAILGGVLIGLAVAGYLGLLAWRRVIERRYGNREILINEDDDLQHFEL